MNDQIEKAGYGFEPTDVFEEKIFAIVRMWSCTISFITCLSVALVSASSACSFSRIDMTLLRV
jgi:hypothetical protein